MVLSSGVRVEEGISEKELPGLVGGWFGRPAIGAGQWLWLYLRGGEGIH